MEWFSHHLLSGKVLPGPQPIVQTQVEDVVDDYEMVDDVIGMDEISAKAGKREGVNDGKVDAKGSTCCEQRKRERGCETSQSYS